MILSLIIFIIGLLGFAFNRKNIILMLLCIELMLLGATLLFVFSSHAFDDILGQTFALYVIVVAAIESAIGLSIIVAFYRSRGNIELK